MINVGHLVQSVRRTVETTVVIFRG